MVARCSIWRDGVTNLFWAADAKLEDISGEKDRMLEDLAEASPEIQAAMVARIIERDGLADLVEEVRRRQAEAEGAGGGGGGQQEGQSTILGPDGNPLASTLGGGPGTPAELRQGLTEQVPKPPNVNTGAFAQ